MNVLLLFKKTELFFKLKCYSLFMLTYNGLTTFLKPTNYNLNYSNNCYSVYINKTNFKNAKGCLNQNWTVQITDVKVVMPPTGKAWNCCCSWNPHHTVPLALQIPPEDTSVRLRRGTQPCENRDFETEFFKAVTMLCRACLENLNQRFPNLPPVVYLLIKDWL